MKKSVASTPQNGVPAKTNVGTPNGLAIC
jgi:hypothetical protein